MKIVIVFSFFQILLAQNLPDDFDVRTKYPECPSVSTPLNQGSCGSCWAFSTTSTTADRLCMRGWTTEFMAPEHPVQCDAGQEACNGGYIRTAFDFQIASGLIPLVCKAYRDTQARRCADTCDDKTPITANMLLKPSAKKALKTKEDIKAELYTFGSVTGSFKVFEEFYEYFDKDKKKHYVVSSQPGAFETYHAVKIVGWTPEGWLIQNSWGKGWADGGYFRIKYGEGEIEKDVYSPVVPEYIDPCAANNGYTCKECDNVTQTDDDGKVTNTACKYCLTTDKCIQVTNKGEPAHGICQKFSENADQCPIDDCEQMSADPLRCLSHKGCGYCVSTRKCRKGLDGPNTGVCQNWYKELGDFASQYKGTRINAEADCKTSSNLWCEGIGKCLDKTPSLNSTQVGRCKGDPQGDGSTGETVKATACGDYTDKVACQGNNSCCWDYMTKKCAGSAGSVASCETKFTGENWGHLSNAEDPIKKDEYCLRYSCKTCKNAAGCVWCGTTQSCIAAHGKGENGTDTAETGCTQIIEDDSNSEDPCSTCIQYSSCTSCALDTTCGWWETSSFCAEGRKEPKSSPPKDNDNFFSYKTQCEIIAEDQLEPYDASLNYQNGGAGGAAARIVRVPQVASYLLVGVASLLALLVLG